MTDATKIRAATIAIVMIALLPVPARANDVTMTSARWSRTLAAEPSYRTIPVLATLPDGGVLARNGAGVAAIDARGVMRWRMPNVEYALVDGGAVVFRRSRVVFAVRISDAGMLWKRACTDPPFVVAAGDRIVTMCAGMSTVLRARDGSVAARKVVKITPSPPMLQGARRLTDRYVLVTNFFDGAWMGYTYDVVDAHTGAFLWGETDADFFDATATTVALTPTPSMLPWGRAGTVMRRRLADGVRIASQDYPTPQSSDMSVRGRMTISNAATYVLNFNTGLFRFPRGETRAPQHVLTDTQASAIAFGSAAFLFTDKTQITDTPLYVDRPAAGGRFETRAVGRFAGRVAVQDTDAWYQQSGFAARVGDRLAVHDNGVVRFYDEFGAVKMTVKTSCAVPVLAATSSLVFVRCAQPGSPGTLTAFARR